MRRAPVLGGRLSLLAFVAACTIGAGCPAGDAPPTAPARSSPPLRVAAGPARTTEPRIAAPPAPAAPADAGAGATAAEPSDPLVEEEREEDPSSETVTIRITVEPRAHVYWGIKNLGLSPVEIQRPRYSGPLDLVVKAAGFLPLHARAFTDRDDRLSLRLYTEEQATRLLGYRPQGAAER